MAMENAITPASGQGQPAPPYEFERLPEEPLEEYRAFLQFCSTDADTATDYLLASGGADMLEAASRFRWMHRRDALWAWRTQARKQRWASYLDGVLNQLVDRRPYLLKRLRFAANFEGLEGLTEEEMADEARRSARHEAGEKEDGAVVPASQRGVHRKYTEALGLFNRDAELALKVLLALKDDGGVNITNQIANMVPPGQQLVKQMADAWGPPR